MGWFSIQWVGLKNVWFGLKWRLEQSWVEKCLVWLGFNGLFLVELEWVGFG